MNIPRLITGYLAVSLLAGCGSESSTAPTVELSPSFVAVAGPRLATGSGHVSSASGRRVFTFHAKDNGDGTGKGSYRINLTAPGLFFEVDVSCVSFAGSTAWVAGHISDTNAAFIQVGSVSYFYAIDHGEGAGALADVVSTARINDVPGEDEIFCRDQPLLLTSFPIEQGNVQVR